MKLTAILLLTACLQVSAKGYSQRVTLSVQNAPLEEVVKELKRQTNFGFFYEKGLFQNASPVTVAVSNQSLEETLALCFSGQPFEYKIVKNNVILKRRELIKIQEEVASKVDNGDFKGRVVTKDGEPLASANVVNKRTGKGTTTDANGNFILRDVNLDDILVITYTGFAPRSIRVSEFITVTLVMEPAINQLDQVVMQAYGQTTKRLATGNIAKVTAEEISKQPVINPLQALQGRVAGLVVSQTSGYSSAPFKIELRGRNAIDPKFTSDPLYIIDGVPLTVLELSTGNYNSGSLGFLQNGLNGPANGQSPFFSINPNDIESIEVLKDADATAIYGSRAANGVIMITTKKAKAGKSKFEISAYQGISKVTRHWDMLNTEEYIQMRREAFKNNSRAMNNANAYDVLVWDSTRYTDWQKYLWGGTGRTTDAQMSLSGGNVVTQFRISTGYHRQTDVLTVSGADERGSLSFSLNHRALKQRLTLLLSTNYSFAKSNLISSPNAVVLSPNAPPVYDSLGNLNYAGWNPVPNSFPFARLLQPYTSKTNNLISGLTIGYQVIKGLTLRSNFGYTNTVVNQLSTTPIASQNPATSPTGGSQFGSQLVQNCIIEPQIEFNALWGKSGFDVLIGGSIQNNMTNGTVTLATGYTNDALLKSASLAPTTLTSDNNGQYKYSALFGRINYRWQNKYIVNLSARRDGSSRFGPSKQFGNFGAIGVAWIFSEENFFKNKVKFLSFGKLRGSYGTTGSDAVGDYKYLTRWSSSTAVPPYLGYTALEPLQHFNPDYHWQVNKKLEAEINLGFLNDRVVVSATWYRNRCDNQLVAFPLPLYTGFPEVTDNTPASVENTGWEFTLSGQVLRLKDFRWSVFSNISFNKNKLLAYPNLEQSPYANLYVIGQSINIQRLLHFTGVDPATGKYTFEDKSGDGTISRNPGADDDRYYYNTNPEYFGGFGTTFSYKKVELSVNFNFIKTIGINALNSTAYPGTIANQPTEVLSRWQKPGDETNVGRYTTLGDVTDSYFHIYSDGIYTDASFVRLQNISLSYSLPEKILKKASIQNCRVFFQGQNLITFTNYKGIDPETRNFGAMPPAKIFTGGLQFNF